MDKSETTPLDDPFTNDAPPPPDDSSSSSSSSSPPPPPSPPSPPSKAPPPPESDPPPPPQTSPPPPPPVKPKDNPPPAPVESPPPPTPKEAPPTSTPAPPPPDNKVVNNPPPQPPRETNNPPPIVNWFSSSPPPPTTVDPNAPSVIAPPANDPLYSPPGVPSTTSPSDRVSPLPNGTNSPPSNSSSDHLGMIVGVSISGVFILALVTVCCLCSNRKKKRYYFDQERPPNGGQYYNGTTQWNNNPQSMEHIKLPPPPGNFSGEYNSGFYNSGQHNQMPPHSPMGGLGFSSQSQFSYDDLAAATSGFSQANLLGQGGFGYVYKGVLPDGRVVAVKSLKSGSGQGEREFQAEVEIISRVHHRHLVSLVGYCIAEGQRMLVYEFVSNSTMEHHLHGKGQPVMDWSSRMRIAIGSAKGLAYLHEDCHPRIIHRDIKAANILLDDNYEAMVADFGLAKLTTDTATHVSTRVMGTFGYLAPEYASSGKLTEKSDVFSFGVMLLELITGHRPVDLTGQIMEDSLVDWARPYLAQALEDGNYDELADPKMEGNYAPNEMASMISCAAASVRHSGKRRPKMSQIVRALEGGNLLMEETTEIPKPKQRSNGSGGTSCSTESAYDTVAYNVDMMKFRNMVMDDNKEQALLSSQYGATSEYGLK